MSDRIYTFAEPDVRFNPLPAGSNVVGFSPMSVPDGSGRVSHPRDFGSGAHATFFRWRARTVAASSPSATGNTVEMFWATFDETSVGVPLYVDGNLGSGDKLYSLPEERKRNLQYIGAITADVGSSGTPFISSGLTQVFNRYGMLVWFNHFGATLSASSGDHEFVLTPVPSEIE